MRSRRSGRPPLALLILAILPILSLLAGAVPAAAQDLAADPFETARIRWGPLAATPRVALQNLGVDTNVFNEWEDPKRDFTAALNPQSDFWVRLGPARLAGKAGLTYVYFNRYRDQRAVNTDDALRLELPLLRIRPYVGVTYVNTRDRPGYEVDARARHVDRGVVFGVDLPISRKTTIGIGVRRNRVAFAGDEVFLGTSLQEVFNRRVDTGTASVRYRVTPLTTLVVQADTSRERFLYTPVRNADSLRVMPGLELSPYALISGRVFVGVRSLDMKDPSIPDFSGVVAEGELAYTLLGVTRFAVQLQRDINYSFEVSQPYYLLTGATFTVTQVVRSPWDLQVRIGRQRLAYRTMAGSEGAGAIAGRADRVSQYGAGLGYRLGSDTRIGLNADYFRRTSPYALRAYEGLRGGLAITYGF